MHNDTEAECHVPRELFKMIMSNMQNAWDYDMNVSYLYASNGETVETYIPTMISDMATLLSYLFELDEDGQSLLEHVCFELNFGREEEATHVTTINDDGLEDYVDLSSFDKLYDYLLVLGRR